MPELPEVETIKNFLEPQIINKTIINIEVLRKSQIVGDTTNFINALNNQTFLKLTRYGKYLFFHLTNNCVIISHLRMEGKFFVLKENEDNTKHARIIFHLNTDEKIIFDDSRCFGIMKLSKEDNYLKEKEIIKLGPEPFDVYDVKSLLRSIKKNSNIKATLLDQTFLAGIGNIYADEILYKCKIHPLTLAKDISLSKWEEIIEQSKIILNESIKANGSTIRSYHPTKDKEGSFQNKLLIYGRKDERCPICNSVFKKTVVAGRGTTYCPMCQRQNKLSIAITGPSGCGKSTCLTYLKNKGYNVHNCDEIVAKLYKNPNFAAFLGKKLNIPFNNYVDKNLLKEYLNKDIKNKKLLESFVHPSVKEEVENLLISNEGIIVIEVPLLFETNMNNLFDVIIAIHSSKQDDLLKAREGDNASTIKKINSNNMFMKYKDKVDLLINNDSSLEELYKNLDNYFNRL